MHFVLFQWYFVADLLKSRPYQSLKRKSLKLLEESNSPIFRTEHTNITINK